MEIHQLRYFSAVVRTGSFTAAADDCAVSQPSLSIQIAKLEDEAGGLRMAHAGAGSEYVALV